MPASTITNAAVPQPKIRASCFSVMGPPLPPHFEAIRRVTRHAVAGDPRQAHRDRGAPPRARHPPSPPPWGPTPRGPPPGVAGAPPKPPGTGAPPPGPRHRLAQLIEPQVGAH